MKKLTGLLAIFPAVALSGIFDERLEDPAKFTSAVEYGRRLQMQTTYPTGRPGPGDTSELANENGMAIYKGQWCLNRTGFDSGVDLRRRFEMFCTARGGTLDGKACLDKADPSRILFIAEVINGPICYRTPKVDMRVIEPTSQPPAEAYVALARGIYEKQKADEEAARLARVRAAELARMRKIGTQVCKNDGNIRYTGFVEQVEEPKLRISIAFAKLVDNPQAQAPGFQPVVVWEKPENWVICE